MSAKGLEWAQARVEQWPDLFTDAGRRVLLAVAEAANDEGDCRAPAWRLGVRANVSPALLEFEVAQLCVAGVLEARQGAVHPWGIERVLRLRMERGALMVVSGPAVAP